MNLLAETLAAAARHQQAGRLDQAERLYREALAREPDNVEVAHLLGVLQLQRDRVEQALEILEQVAGARPDDADVLASLGLAYRRAERLDEAKACFSRVISKRPDDAAAHTNLGDVLLAKGELDRALQATEQAVSLGPELHQAHFNLGNLRLAAGEVMAALEAFSRAEELAPDDWQTKSNMGLIFKAIGSLEPAETYLRRALLLDPGNPVVSLNLASVLLERGQHAEAEALCREVTALLPRHPMPQNNLALALLGQGRQAEAVLALLKALSLDPKDPRLQINLARALRLEGKLDKAVEAYERALGLAPDGELPLAAYEGATARLLLGRYQPEVWAGLQARRRLPGHGQAPYELPSWQGEPLEQRTLLVYGEGGLAEALLLLRFLPELRRRGARVVLETPPAVRALAEHNAALYDALCAPGEAPEGVELKVSLDELPGLLGLGPGVLGGGEAGEQSGALPPPPYLAPDPALAAAWQQKLDLLPGGLNVGVLWQAEPEQPALDEPYASLPLLALEPLFALPNTRWYSFQYHATDAEREALARAGVRDLANELADVADALACLTALDLLITPQSTIAHLVGAAGLPARVLLDNAPHWCWGLKGSKTPWYPTLQLHRRPRYGPWDELLTSLSAELKDKP